MSFIKTVIQGKTLNCAFAFATRYNSARIHSPGMGTSGCCWWGIWFVWKERDGAGSSWSRLCVVPSLSAPCKAVLWQRWRLELGVLCWSCVVCDPCFIQPQVKVLPQESKGLFISCIHEESLHLPPKAVQNASQALI